MKNVYKLKTGRWQFDIVYKGRRFRKNFKSEEEALAYSDCWRAIQKQELDYFLGLTLEQLLDIKQALSLLPEGASLTDVVKEYNVKQ